MRKNLKFLFVLFLLPLIGCSDDDNNKATELILEKTKIALTPSTKVSVTIEQGSGEYTVVSSDISIALASVLDNVITISSKDFSGDRGNAIVVVTDKAFNRKTIDVTVVQNMELRLNVDNAELYLGSETLNSSVVKIETGCFGYKIELIGDTEDLVDINTSELESAERFTIIAKAKGKGEIKVTDIAGNSATMTVAVEDLDSILEDLDKKEVVINAVQGTDVITAPIGGIYSIKIDNPNIVKARVEGNKIIVTGKRNGQTTIKIKDERGPSYESAVTVDGRLYSVDFGHDYFAHTSSFAGISEIDNSITQSKQVTYEMCYYVGGFRGGQSFMGLQNNLFIKGKRNGDDDSQPIQIVGPGGELLLESKYSMPLQRWIHVALVVDCNKTELLEKYKLYVNGKREELVLDRMGESHSIVDLAKGDDGNRFQIGRGGGDDWRISYSRISYARVWTVVRTEEQIKSNIMNLPESDNQGLLAHWDFTAGVETDYIQDIAGGKYENNLIISRNHSHNYDPVMLPIHIFIEKLYPQIN